MTALEKSPADLILEVLEAARALLKAHGFQAIFPGPEADLGQALSALQKALDREAQEMGQPAAGHWEPSSWAHVKAGDRVRVGGQHEAEVRSVTPRTWLGSGASQIMVSLEGRPTPYTMPPSGPVEIWRASLPDWAAQAYLTMAEGGLTRG